MIKESEITFLLCGYIDDYHTELSIHSIKSIFPESKILISTWNDFELIAKKFQRKYGVDCIFSDDPGSEIRKIKPVTYHNANRVIKSSKVGLSNVNTKYVFKTRSDVIFNSKKFLYYFNKYKSINNKNIASILNSTNPYKSRILISNQTTIDPDRGPKLLYHPCDWFMFGETNDINLFFEIDFISNEMCTWYRNNTKPEDSIDSGNLSLYMLEDYIGYMALKNFFKINHDCYISHNENEILNWKHILGSLFIVVDNKSLNLACSKYINLKSFHLYKSVSHVKWKILAKIDVKMIEVINDIIIYKYRKFIFVNWLVLKYIKKVLIK